MRSDRAQNTVRFEANCSPAPPPLEAHRIFPPPAAPVRTAFSNRSRGLFSGCAAALSTATLAFSPAPAAARTHLSNARATTVPAGFTIPAQTNRIDLSLGGKLKFQSLPAYADRSGEVYSPVLEAVNSTFGGSLTYDPGQNLVEGAAPDGRKLALPVAANRDEATRDHTAYVEDGQVFVPLHTLARLTGFSFDVTNGGRSVSLMPRIASVSIIPMDHAVRIQIHGSAPLGFVKVSYYDSPWRIVLDVSGMRTWPGVQRSFVPGLAQVRWKEWPTPGHVRIVVELTSQLTFHLADSGRPFDYWIDIDQTRAPGFPTAPDRTPAGADDGVDTPESSGPDSTAASVPATISSSTGSNMAAASVPPAAVATVPGGAVAPAAVEVLPVTNSVGTGNKPPADGSDRQAQADARPKTVASIQNISVRAMDARTTQITLKATGPVECRPSFFDSPSRLVLDIPNSVLDLQKDTAALNGPGLLRIRTGEFPKGSRSSRVVLDLSGKSVFRVWSEQDHSVVQALIRDTQMNSRGEITGSPVANHIICIDPGHCGVYTGCRGYFGLKEEEVTLDVALRLEQLLTAAGAQVVMTRRSMAAPAGGAGLEADLIRRASIGNNARADLFLSIHCNAMPDGAHGSERGSQVIYGHRQSAHWASIVYQSLLEALGHGGTGLHFRPRIKVTEFSDMPSALAELGFLDERSDAALLAEPSFRQKEAECLFHAFEQYFAQKDGTSFDPLRLAPVHPEGPEAPTITASAPGAVPGSGASSSPRSPDAAVSDPSTGGGPLNGGSSVALAHPEGR